MTLAFSYSRFSSDAQADGDSDRRQDSLRDQWLRRNPAVRLAEAFQDRGISAFRGKHRTEGALKRFLDLVTGGNVPQGSYLLVENLDRLTRESPWDAISFLCTIVKSGIRVVTLSPSEVEYSKDKELAPLILACVEFGRGNSESVMKSKRVSEARTRAKQEARETNKPMNASPPAWLELIDGKYRVKDGAAKIVRQIFRMCASGAGVHRITQKLNADKVPPLGRSGKWVKSYLVKMLQNRAVLGEYQPKSVSGTKRVPDGDVILNHYPAVLTETEFHAAQKGRESRNGRCGRPAKGTQHLFSGLLRDAINQCPIRIETRATGKYLESSKSVNGEGSSVFRCKCL